LAYKNRCLNVRSATASRKKNSVDSMKRSNRAISTNVRSLPTKTYISYKKASCCGLLLNTVIFWSVNT
jgi:hypothetical protein